MTPTPTKKRAKPINARALTVEQVPFQPIRFFVPGIPRPGGSKKAFYIAKLERAVVTDASGENGKLWRQAVSVFAAEAYAGPLLSGPTIVTFRFVMPRPKKHYGAKGLKPNAPMFHTGKPDVLKLSRSTEDALTSVIWHDDSATVDLRATKVYGERPGVEIEIQRATQELFT